MENLQTMAVAIQYSYEDELDETINNEELKQVAFDAAKVEYPMLDHNSLDLVANLVVDLYDVI